MNSTFGVVPDHDTAAARSGSGMLAALSAAAITVPHALGLGLLAFAPLAGDMPVAALALWSAALPSAVLAVFARRPGVVHAPTTVVALLFASVVATVTASASNLGLAPAQVLAVCGATVALGFAFQWLFGVLRLASVASFLPISVTHGFAAGVGLSMVVGQIAGGFGAGSFAFDARTLRHAILAVVVMLAARAFQKRWRHWPGLLPAAFAVSVLVVASGMLPLFRPAAAAAHFAWPPLPEWSTVPWLQVANTIGIHLVSLAMLMAIVNSIDVLVFNQELELEHGLRSEPNQALRRESLVGVLCGLAGLIPASTSASRSRIALSRAGPNAAVAPMHAAMLLGVAATGYLWLPFVPMACLSGALLLAGFTQVPRPLWSRTFARAAPATWSQGWLVALVFAVSGGVGALVAGLVVATFVLLHASASTALRRSLLDGQVRSRRLRRAADEAWIGPRMNSVAVFELQGVMSFGVAAHLADQVLAQLRERHHRAILDASRVPSWDGTATARLALLARDVGHRGVPLTVCGLDARTAATLPGWIRQEPDLDRALERAEDEILEERPVEARESARREGLLGELAEGMSEPGRRSLEALLEPATIGPGEAVFAFGDTEREMLIVQSGRITLCTSWPPAGGMRLATVAGGMAFGEMAFLSGQPRTASAGAENAPATLVRLSRERFDEWARGHAAEALVFMSNLAQIGTRRLAATTRQLRSALE